MNARKIFYSITLGATFGLASCASGGNESIKNETGTTFDQKIHDGETTKEQICQIYGDPAQTTFTDSGHE